MFRIGFSMARRFGWIDFRSTFVRFSSMTGWQFPITLSRTRSFKFGIINLATFWWFWATTFMLIAIAWFRSIIFGMTTRNVCMMFVFVVDTSISFSVIIRPHRYRIQPAISTFIVTFAYLFHSISALRLRCYFLSTQFRAFLLRLSLSSLEVGAGVWIRILTVAGVHFA